MNIINFVFYGMELDEFGFPINYYSVIAYYGEIDNLGIVVLLNSIAGKTSVDQPLILKPPNGLIDKDWIETSILEILTKNINISGLNIQIFR
jgi:hypothetical protein